MLSVYKCWRKLCVAWQLIASTNSSCPTHQPPHLLPQSVCTAPLCVRLCGAHCLLLLHPSAQPASRQSDAWARADIFKQGAGLWWALGRPPAILCTARHHLSPTDHPRHSLLHQRTRYLTCTTNSPFTTHLRGGPEQKWEGVRPTSRTNSKKTHKVCIASGMNDKYIL